MANEEASTEVREIDNCESYKGCCDGPEWRGRLCPYHEGYVDGADSKQDKCELYGGELEKLRENFAAVVALWVEPRSPEAADELRDENVLPR